MYYLYTEVDWVENAETYDYAITSYCDQQIMFNPMTPSPEDILRMAAFSMLDDGKAQDVEECPWEQAPEAVRYMFKTDFFYTFSVIVNLSDVIVGERVTFTTFDGCTLMPPDEGCMYDLEAAPG